MLVIFKQGFCGFLHAVFFSILEKKYRCLADFKNMFLEKHIENLALYDTIFLGFPIWYYAAPNIIQTFLKEHDFSGLKIALFATSGGSDINKCAAKLEPYLASETEIIGAKLFSPNVSANDLYLWTETL